jgi:hypothetical protein
LKTQNIYKKPLWKPLNTYNKPCFETAYLGENLKNLVKQKVAPKVTIILGYYILSKIIMSLQKKPNWQKNAQSGHPGCLHNILVTYLGLPKFPLIVPLELPLLGGGDWILGGRGGGASR